MKELEENITPSSIGGMGAVLLPTATQDGSGDIPAGRGDATKEYKKKKKKMKKLQNFESFVSEIKHEILVTEAFSRMPKDTIENELYAASQALTTYYDWLKAGNDSGKGESIDHVISLLKKCKSNIKRFNKPEEVKGTAFESVANELVNESFSSFLFNSPNEFGEFMNSAPDKGETKYLVFAHNKVNFNGQEIKLSGGYGIGSATSKSILGIFDNEQSAKDAYKAAMKKPEGNFVSFTMGTLLALTKFRSQYTEIEGHLAKIKIK
jgi:hypothetical protein